MLFAVELGVAFEVLDPVSAAPPPPFVELA